MINQIQTIRTIFGQKLANVPFKLEIDRDFNGNEIANGDRASAVIEAGNARVRVVCSSSYIESKYPLGRVTMTDLATGQVIDGGKSDELWGRIVDHVRNVSLPPEHMPIADGIRRLVADGIAEGLTKALTPADDGRMPHLGQGVKFILDSGIVIAGMDELAAVVTKVISPTKVCLTVFPLTSDIFWREDVPRRSEKYPRACWDFADGLPPPAAIAIPEPIARQRLNVETDNDVFDPPRRPRGRPPKPVAA